MKPPTRAGWLAWPPMHHTEPRHDEPRLWPAYLHFFREQLIDGVLALSPVQQHTSRVPSGWTPIELLSHVLHMEQRWFVWGFLGEPTPDAWGDWAGGSPGTRWAVPDDVTAEQLAERLRALGRRTTQVLADHDLAEVAAEGERFEGDPATLEWICLHVLAEYARHAGHLDIVAELGDR